MSNLSMTPQEQAKLWQQRLFEADMGMNNYVISLHGQLLLGDWIRTQKAVFENLPIDDFNDTEAWKKAFFRTQALLEHFIVGHFGEEAMTDWSRESAKIYSILDEEGYGQPIFPILRIAKQAELYGSNYIIIDTRPTLAEVHIQHCAIWDYRELARASGVKLTLQSPCIYCTRSMSSLIRAQGCVPDFHQSDNSQDHGCQWRAFKTGRVGHHNSL